MEQHRTTLEENRKMREISYQIEITVSFDFFPGIFEISKW